MKILKVIKNFIPKLIKEKIRIILIRRRFPDAIIYSGAEVGNDCFLKEKVVIFKGAQIALGTLIARYSYIQSGSVAWNADIGAFCSIARNVSIGLAAHPKSMVSSSPVFYDDKVPLPQIFVKGTHFKNSLPRTVVGSDVWIGEGVKILAGITIGNGAIIGAGSIVTKDIPAYSISVGVPCKPINKRFSDEIEKKIIASEWWTWPEEELLNHANYFSNVDHFLKMINNKK